MKWISESRRGGLKDCVSFGRTDARSVRIISRGHTYSLISETAQYVGCGDVCGWNRGIILRD